jgi:putative DNA primase/helicase
VTAAAKTNGQGISHDAPASDEKPCSLSKAVVLEALSVNTQMARRFFDAIWADGLPDGCWIGLWTLPDKKTRWCASVEEAVKAALNLASGKRDVYFHLALAGQSYGPDVRLHMEDRPPVAIPGVWADLDVGTDGHKPGKVYPPSIEEAMRLLNDCLQPTMLVDSGGGLHAYWLFKEPWVLDSEAEVKAAADLSKRFQEFLQAHYKKSGWDVDSTHDLVRILRVAGTANRKLPDNPRPVAIILGDGPRYNPDDIEDLLDERCPAVGELYESGSAPTTVNIAPVAAEKVKLALDVLLEDSRFRRTWNLDRPDLSDQTLSTYDMSLASQAASLDVDDGIIAALIGQFRRKHGNEKDVKKGLRPSYLRNTIAKAMSKAAGTVTVYPEPLPAQVEPDNGQGEASQAVHAEKPSPTAPAITINVADAIGREQRGAADVYVALRRGRRVFDHAEGMWYAFNGVFWEPDRVGGALSDIECVVRLYGDEARRIGAEAYKAKIEQRETDAKKADAAFKAAIARVRDLRKRRYIEDVLKLAADGKGGLSTPGDEWDRNPMLLAVANGIIDLTTGQLRPGRAEDMIRSASPTPFMGLDAPCPTWEHFVFSVMNGDSEKAAFLRRLFGYAATGLTTEHIFAALVGRGRNGKTVLMEAIANVLGPRLAGPSPSEMLLLQDRTKMANAPTPEILALYGRRLSWTSETEDGRRFNAQQVKWLTGGDTLRGRPPYGKQEVAFKSTHTLMMLTNFAPVADGDDDAFWDRFNVLKFPVRFVDERDPDNPLERVPDKGLPEKLKQEAPGILAWLVRGCLEWQRIGLAVPKSIRAETLSYRSDCDPLGMFLAEVTVQGDGFQVSARALFGAYRQWCEANHERPLNKTAFGRRISRRFRKTPDRMYHGVKLNALWANLMPEAE